MAPRPPEHNRAKAATSSAPAVALQGFTDAAGLHGQAQIAATITRPTTEIPTLELLHHLQGHHRGTINERFTQIGHLACE